jgi:hypothetical protein
VPVLNDLLAPPVHHDIPRVESHDDITVIRRRRRWPIVLIGTVTVLLAGGGAGWHQAVTADPGLVFDGGPNVFRTEQGGDTTGIQRAENSFGTDVNVDYEPGGQVHGYFGLYNHGPRDVTIEAAPTQGFYYWAFDGLALSKNWHTALAGLDYTPFHPFTLRRGETRYVRLDFRTATCDPAGLQTGSSRINSIPLRYRVLGVTRTVPVPFDQVAIAIQTIGTCDQPFTNHA